MVARSHGSSRRAGRPGDLLKVWFPSLGGQFVQRFYVPRRPAVAHGALRRFELESASIANAAGLIRSAPSNPPPTVYVPCPGGTRQLRAGPRRALAHYERGHTVSFETPLVPGVERLSMSLARALGTSPIPPATVLSRTGEAVPEHFDGIDAFVLMARGRKRWTIGPNTIDFPNCSYFPSARGPGARGGSPLPDHLRGGLLEMPREGARSFVLEPGSVAFVPSGWWHRTECLEDSISFTFRIQNKPLSLAVGQALARRLERSAVWRAPLLLRRSQAHRAEVEKQLRAAVKRLSAELGSLDVGDILRVELGERYRPRKRVVRMRRLAADTTALVVSRPRSHERVELEMDDDFIPLMRWILSQKDDFFDEDARSAFPEVAEDDLRATLEAALSADLIGRIG